MNPADSRDELRHVLADVAEAKLARHEKLTALENGAFLLRVWEGADPESPAMLVRSAIGIVGQLVDALAATPAPTASLDAAVGEVESLLPEGWSFWEVAGHPEYEHAGTVHPARVFARVRLANIIDSHGMVPEASASGPTILAALLALASRLHNEEPGQ